MSEGWVRYAELARELDAARVQESARTAGMREAAAEMFGHSGELEARLNGQRGMLQNLAQELRLRTPDLTPSIPGGDADPATSLAQVAGAIDRSDKAARAAAERGQYAGFLPGLSAAGRSFVVYGTGALVVLLIQIPQWMHLVDSTAEDTAGPSFVLMMILLPALAFVIAYIVLSFGARTRMATARQRARTRMGLLMCFGIGPLGLLVFFAVNWQQNLPN